MKPADITITDNPRGGPEEKVKATYDGVLKCNCRCPKERVET
jgi:hypothetical protein